MKHIPKGWAEADGDWGFTGKKPGKYPFSGNIIREAEDVMDYIDSWEPDDEDDELDEEALWAPVRSHFHDIPC